MRIGLACLPLLARRFVCVQTRFCQTQTRKRPPFGDRYLTDPSRVFEHNSWDNVEWDEDQDAQAKQKVSENAQDPVPPDLQETYEAKADEFWNDFYSIHQNRFFKDRHWLFTEFPELDMNRDGEEERETEGAVCTSDGDKMTGAAAVDKNTLSDINKETGNSEDMCTSKEVDGETERTNVEKEPMALSSDSTHNPAEDCGSEKNAVLDELCQTLGHLAVRSSSAAVEDGDFPGQQARTRMFEVGCGVGNTVFPILQTNNDPGLFMYCCDFSATAIDIVKQQPDYNTRRCHAFVHDLTDTTSSLPFPPASLDIIIMIFVLSAIHPDKMQSTVDHLAKYLKPGGKLLFRDYGRYDLAQLRFKKGRCLSDNFYVRGDGTRVYFFTQDELRTLFGSAGLQEELIHVDRRLQVNRGRQVKMYRVWLLCKFTKPLD
ncbi:tRNA N(3)-methylcytidine methyltransferase METTL2-like isoform X1 [Branchiostoma floridae]|uniref:tRNA N(3)-methylcytidine methyltransferase n=2 Tax=Branchiostoma floridae TaxID=7739 RepID=A0A9J7LTN8_BRAFL|nr:tRNA N(3)-methylcytidine methyltransferase METTL2-like isoform X1 [Branchiostoma floridae]